MRVGVVGAGATGGLYGGLLARAGHDVRFLARGANLAPIRERGLQVRSAQFGEFTVEAPASDRAEELGPVDFVLFAVKTYDLASAAEAARAMLAPGGTLLTLQNGVEAPDQVASVVGREAVLIGTTALETTVSAPGVVDHLSRGHRITVSELDGPPTPRVEALAETLRGAGMNALVVPDGRRALWEKASFLIPLAALTAATGSGIGPIRTLPETRVLLDAVFAEVASVAAAAGYVVSEASQSARHMAEEAAPTMKASMARDFERGRPTELEALLGVVVRLGEQRGVPVPVSRVLYGVLKLRAQQAALDA